MKNKRKITLSMQEYNALHEIFKGDIYVLGQLKVSAPETDVSELLDHIANLWENKELTNQQVSSIENNKYLMRQLRLSIEDRKKSVIDVETRSAVMNILHFNNSKWLYPKLTSNEVIEISKTKFSEMKEKLEELTAKYNRKTFDKEF